MGNFRSVSFQQLTKDGCHRRGIKKRERTEKKQPSGKFLSEDMCWQRSKQDSSRSLKRQRRSDNVFSINGPHQCFFLWCCKTLKLSKIAESCELSEQSNNYVIKVIFQVNYIETVSYNGDQTVDVCISNNRKMLNDANKLGDVRWQHTRAHATNGVTYLPEPPVMRLGWLQINASSLRLSEFTPEFIAVRTCSGNQSCIFSCGA